VQIKFLSILLNDKFNDIKDVLSLIF